MRAVILAAGEGRRLKRYTENLPKGMLAFHGKPLIRHQIDAYHAQGIRDITVVRGFCGHAIPYTDVTYVENPRWAETNMVESLLCARALFDDDLLVSYADICFDAPLLRAMRTCPHQIGVAVDLNWQAYWQKRYGRIDFDTESLKFDAHGRIVSLGVSDPPLAEISGRYIGMLKFSARALREVVAIYESAKLTHWEKPWQQSGKPFRQAYMTDLLQELIDRGEAVQAVTVSGGWLEFDTNEDYERQRDWPFDEGLSTPPRTV
ncbi:MAG: phosphocholine cytidylyltransferase family protein [Lentisphaerae bacterium]|nr:phosphocholine cytidylyltransferase family protein [Lentisphaerota bacterium]